MKKNFIFYHFLFAFFPVLFLYSHNIEEVSFDVVFVPLVLSLGLTCIVWIIFKLLLKNKQKAALLTFLFMFMFFSFGHFLNLLNKIVLEKIKIPSLSVIIFWMILFSLLAVLILRTRKDLNIATSILNVFVGVLILVPLAQILFFHISTLSNSKTITENIESLKLGSSSQKDKLPDIYYLIFDRYANASSLEEYYNYDNSDFIHFLTEKGFYVASKSKCNYYSSHLSLSSSLNMKYLDDLLEKGPIKQKVIYRMLKDFKVWRLLKSVGYKYIHFGSWYELTKTNKLADINFKDGGFFNLSQDFMLKFLEMSILAPFVKSNIVLASHRENVLKTFEGLAKLPDIKGPKFIFAHILLPHHPFIFGPNGERPNVTKNRGEKYLDQLKFTNSKIKWLVNELLAKSSTPPIIILQSDEGPGGEEIPMIEYLKYKGRLKNIVRLRLRCRILNAYYLPDVDKTIFYENISPVNTFRLIFNLYFGTKYELLEDTTYRHFKNKDMVKKFERVPQGWWSRRIKSLK